MQLQESISLAPLTTLQVGGAARYFVEAINAYEIREALDFAKTRSLPVFVLGGGSNLVISDQGWPGLVLKIGILGINHRHGNDQTAYFDAGAGEDWDGFVAAAVMHHCSGIECLSGIPGSVGGTPVQNVGAYGQEVSQTIESVTALDRTTGEEVEIEREDCGFGYRSSIFNTRERGRYIILRVAYALTHSGAPHLEYADLKKFFAGRESGPSLKEVREAVLAIRASKGMVIRPGEEEARSAGSFFKNPVLTEAEFSNLRRLAATRGLEIPSYPGLEAKRKISAAWLVEQSGFAKGYVRGHVGISRKHALAIVNRGGATAAEVIALKDEIQQRVEAQWGVRLEPEPVMVGFEEQSSVVSR
jgi:UDP-N-acetylmuramate dehydrogenase